MIKTRSKTRDKQLGQEQKITSSDISNSMLKASIELNCFDLYGRRLRRITKAVSCFTDAFLFLISSLPGKPVSRALNLLSENTEHVVI